MYSMYSMHDKYSAKQLIKKHLKPECATSRRKAVVCASGIITALTVMFTAGQVFATAGIPPAHAQMLIPFISNQGQIADDKVLFHTRTFAGGAFVKQDGGIVYSIPAPANSGSRTMAALEEFLIGARQVTPIGAEPSAVKVNILRGPRDSWRQNIPCFQAVDMPGVYDGIDLRLRAHERNVEKIFTVAPGANPYLIRMQIKGIESLTVTGRGELEAGTALGKIRFSRPLAWQESGVAGGQAVNIPVEVAYSVNPDNSFQFQLGDYDPTRPLIIDPLLAGTFIGGSGADAMTAMAQDPATSNIYIAGYTDSTDFLFPEGNGVITNHYDGATNALVTKFNPQLTDLLAATFIGGDGTDQALAIAFNASNNCVYVGGGTDSTNFTGGVINHGGRDGFVVRLDADLQNATSLLMGGEEDDAVYTMHIHNDNVLAAGATASTNFNLVATNAWQSELRGATNAFLAILHPDFDLRFSSATYMGGDEADAATAMTIDADNNLLVAGYTSSTDFPTENHYVGDSYQTNLLGFNNAFIAKFNAGYQLLAATYLGGSDFDYAQAVAVDISNNVFVVGRTSSTDFPTNNIFDESYQTNLTGTTNVFIARLTPTLIELEAATYMGGTNIDSAFGVTVIGDTNSTDVFVAGYTRSTDFPTTPNVYSPTHNGGADAFLSKFTGELTTNALQNSTFLGGTDDDAAYAIMMAPDANTIYLAGITASTDFPIPGFTAQPEYGGGTSDGFAVALGTAMTYGGTKWQIDLDQLTSEADDGAIATSPSMGWDGTIYVGFGSNLFAFNPDGSHKWTSDPMHGRAAESAGGIIRRGLGPAPTIDTNGTIYLATARKDPGSNSWIYAFNSDGTTKWAVEMDAGAIFSSPAIGHDDIIYFGSMNAGTFYTRDAETGTNNIWVRPLGSAITASPLIDTNGIVYVTATVSGGGGHELCALNPTNGNTIWSWVYTGAGDGISSPLLDTNGVLYVAGGSDIHAFNTRTIYTNTPDPYLTWSTDATIYGSPVVDSNGFIYVGSSNKMWSFNPNGSTRWECQIDGEIKSTPAIGADGSIYFGAYSNKFYSLSSSGTTNWMLELYADAEIDYQSPMIGTDGTVYMSEIWNLYALYGPSPMDNESGWPTFAHDVLRTGNAGFDPRRHAAPTGVQASQGVYTDRVLVTWDPLDNVINYEVWRSPTNDTATAQRIRTLSNTNYTDTAVEPGRIYYYWLRARTHVVVLSDFSTEALGGTPPLPPTNATASKGIPTNYVEVTWQEPDYGTSYDIYRSFENDTNTATRLGTSTSNYFADHGVTAFPGRTHYYWVTADNEQGYTSIFSEGDGTNNAGGIPPLAPTNLEAGKGLTSTNVALTWDAANYDVTAYVIYRHDEPTSAGAAPIHTNDASTAFNDEGSVPFKPYYYWVRATNQYGISDYSDYDYGFTVLLPPWSVTASIDQTNRVNVSWEIESEAASSYQLYRGANTNPAQAQLLTELPYTGPSATNFSDFSISRGTEYYYFTRARNEYGLSDYSPPSNLGGTFPLPPTGVEASSGTQPALIEVTWSASASPGTRGYRIYRATTPDPNMALNIGATDGALALTDTGSEPGQFYYYWATATNLLGASVFSGVNSGWHPLATPDNVTAGNGESTNLISVTWSSVRNADRYEIWRNTSDNTAGAVKLENDWPSLNYNDTDTVAGEIYYYWVRAKNNQFTSAFSVSASGFRALGEVDLAAESLIFKPNVLAPDSRPTAVSFRIANRGPRDMETPNSRISVDFYLSASRTFVEADAHWMGALSLDMPLAAGERRLYTLSAANMSNLNIPHVPTGAYYVFVYVRHALPSTWNDPVPGNNYISRTGGTIMVNLTGGAQQFLNDYDGDGKADPAVYRGSDGLWRVWLSGDNYREITATGLGGTGYTPVPADYDGDGRTDPAVYRESDGMWRAWFSGANYAEVNAPGLGGSGLMPVPGGYDYDVKSDPAIYDMHNARWRIWMSSTGYAPQDVTAWGGNELIPVIGDYNGDGLSDLAVYHQTTGYWFIRTLAGEQVVWGIHLGGEGFLPVPGDYNGDGRMDMVVYHVATGRWYAQTVTGNIIAAGVLLGGPDFTPASHK